MKIIKQHGTFSVWFCNPLFLTWWFLTVFSIQRPLHLNKLTQQILKKALQNMNFDLLTKTSRNFHTISTT